MTPVVRLLLFATVGAYFLQQTLPPGLANLLAFVPSRALLQPWSIVTYMFLHGGFTHILFNMLGLFFFGPRVEARIGSRHFAWMYFVSGITGAVLSLFLAPGAAIIGASAGVFGVSLAFAWFWPHEQILIWGVIPVPARVLVIVTGLIALWSGFGGVGGGIAHFAHLGGYLGAFLYLKLLQGKLERQKGAWKKRVTTAPPEASTRLSRGWKSIDPQRVHEVNRDEVNRLLDKISAQGIGSLTPQERTFLSNFAPPDDRVPPVA